MLFIIQVKKRLGPTSAREYGSDLLAIQEKLRPDLTSMVKALAATNRTVEKKAVTMDPDTLIALLDKLEEPEERTLWLQWMTASRWSDVAKEGNGCKIIFLNTFEVAVLFGQTKANRREKTREDHQVIVRRNPRLPDFFTKPLAGGMSKWSTTKMDAWLGLQGTPSEHESRETVMTSYTTHAVKRGALHLLVLRAAQIPGFPVHLIPLLAKHKGRSEMIPTVTMRYLSGDADRIALARTLRTHEATEIINPF